MEEAQRDELLELLKVFAESDVEFEDCNCEVCQAIRRARQIIEEMD